MQGFYNITEKIRVQLAQDDFVNTITYGDIFRVDLKKQTIFPLSHVVVNNATMEKNIIRYSISVMAMDIVDISKDAIDNTAIGQYRGNDNEQDVLNTQQAVLLRLLKVLEGGELFTSLYQLDGNPNLEPFTERFENYLAGWVATFDVLIPNDMIACDGATIPSPGCADATAITTDSLGNQLYSNSIPSGDTETQVITNSTAVLKDTSGTTISTTSILAQGSQNITAPNSTYLVEYVNGTDIQSGSIVSGGSVTVTVPNPIVCANTTLEVNGTTEGTVASGSTVDIQLSDSGGVVTPTSVTQVGNDFQIVLPDAPAPTPRSTATLMKTGQTVSYATDDDGMDEYGRATNFLTLDSAPLHNDGNPTLNTTTNRFTDVLGGQTYTNTIVLDWSTWNGATLKAYRRTKSSGYQNWTSAMASVAGLTIGGFTGWKLPNRNELENLINEGVSTSCLNYAPFSITVDTNLWSSTTAFNNTANARGIFSTGNGGVSAIPKTTVAGEYIPCRTMNLSTLNVLS